MVIKLIQKIFNPLQLGVNIINLHFKNKELEIEFTRDYEQKNVTLATLFTILSALFFCVFYLIYNMSHPAWFIIMIVFSVSIGVSIHLKFTQKFNKVGLLLYSLIIVLSYNHRMLFYDGTDIGALAEYFMGLILIILAVNSFIRLRFDWVLFLNTTFFVAFFSYSVWGIGINHVNPEYFIYSSLVFLTTVVVICISVYNNEYLNRHAFIQHKIIRQQAYALKEAKENTEQKVIERTRELEQERNRKLLAVIEGQQIERQRIAQDLHDSLNIKLIVLKRSIEQSSVPDDKELLTEVDSVIEQVREISHNLLPYALKHFGLIKAVDDLCLKLGKENELEVQFSKIGIDENSRWDTVIEAEIYRILQELVANCIKHAKASLLFVEFIADEKTLYISVEDNGIGFDLNDAGKARFGLNNIEVRINLMGGTISYDSQQGTGTTVMINIPIT